MLSANDDGFLTVNPEDYYNLEDYGEESKVSNQLHKENNTSDQNALPTLPPPSTTATEKKHPFNIAVKQIGDVQKILKKQQRIFRRKILNLSFLQEMQVIINPLNVGLT